MNSNLDLEEVKDLDKPDPNSIPPSSMKVYTKSYDFVVDSLVSQIERNEISLNPAFQRRIVWGDKKSSLLIESIVLNVPIPPCYLAQNSDFEIDVVDGQQRLNAIYTFVENKFKLSGLIIMSEFNGRFFHELPIRVQRQIRSHTITCEMITNESDPDIRFEVFERLNSTPTPLSALELRNCIYRGGLNDLLIELAGLPSWLKFTGRREPDARMGDEELILRYFSFYIHGFENYKIPLKSWMNNTALEGKKFDEKQIAQLREHWLSMLDVCCALFEPKECFRRPQSRSINKALFDLVAFSATKIQSNEVQKIRTHFRKGYFEIFDNEDFDDLISRAIDHKSRTQRRFEIWHEHFKWLLK